MTTPLPTLTKEEKKRKIWSPPPFESKVNTYDWPTSLSSGYTQHSMQAGDPPNGLFWVGLQFMWFTVLELKTQFWNTIFWNYNRDQHTPSSIFYVKHIPQINFQTK